MLARRRSRREQHREAYLALHFRLQRLRERNIGSIRVVLITRGTNACPGTGVGTTHLPLLRLMSAWTRYGRSAPGAIRRLLIRHLWTRGGMSSSPRVGRRGHASNARGRRAHGSVGRPTIRRSRRARMALRQGRGGIRMRVMRR